MKLNLILLIVIILFINNLNAIKDNNQVPLDNKNNNNNEQSHLNYIETGKNGLNDTLYWGTYKPHTYFSMKTRSTKPINTGLIWSTPNINNQFTRFLYKCHQGHDGISHYEWLHHDGKHFGTQEIFDQGGKVNLTTSFIKNPGPNGGDWTVRISGRSNSYLTSPIVSLWYYITDESITPTSKNPLKLKNIEGEKKSKKGLEGDVKVQGNHPEIGDYTLYFSDVPESTHPKGPFLKSQGSTSKWHYYGMSKFDENTNWDIVPSIMDRTTQEHLQAPYTEWAQLRNLSLTSGQQIPPFIPTLPNKFSDHSNTVAIQRILKVPFDIEISFVSHEFHKKQDTNKSTFDDSDVEKVVKEMTGPLFNKIRDTYEKKFNDTFYKKFFDISSDKPYHVKIARKILAGESYNTSMSTLSNVLGGFGYWYGKSLIRDIYNKTRYQTNPSPLYSASPSRPAFPRGFLWDEGFHQLVVSSFDVSQTIESLSHWFNLMDETGWIPREQILGKEATSMVPEEFRVQSYEIANPPSLMLTVNKLLDILEGFKMKDDCCATTQEDVDRIQEFLGEAYPRLVRFYQFYWTTQSSVVEGLFRWRGRVENHTLSSGLDDYPRPSPPSVNEIHVDLSSWMAFFANCLTRVSLQLGKNEKKYIEDYNQITSNIERLLWDEATGVYQDIIYRGEDDREFFRTHGYVNYFPLLLGLIPEDSPRLFTIINSLKDVDGIWTRFGILSLSKKDKYFGTNENYWRGPIWFNLNYLFTHSMSKNYLKSGPYKDVVYDIYTTLRLNLLTNILSTHKQSGCLWEQYDPFTGEGKRNHPFNGWTSLISLIISEHY